MHQSAVDERLARSASRWPIASEPRPFPVELKIYRGATHSFLEAVSIAPLADRAFADTAAWLRSARRSHSGTTRTETGE